MSTFGGGSLYSMFPQIFGGGIVGGAGAAGAAGGLGGLAGFATGPWGMMASAGLQAFMGARQAQAQAMARRIQFEESEFQRKWQNQVQNREIAKSNAAKWFMNKKIGEIANRRRAERDFYLRYNFMNEAGEFSKQSKQVNDTLVSTLHSRGIGQSSGTSKALLRQAIEQRNKQMTSQRMSYENALLGSSRQQKAELNQRDFNYNAHIPFMPGVDGTPSGSDAFQSSLMGGIGSVAGAGIQGTINQEMLGALV
jgi:hypothetical protein